MNRPTLVVADDHDLILDALRGVLGRDYRILAEVGDGPALVAAVLSLRPTFVVLDVSMPLLNGIEAAKQIKSHHPGTPLIFVTMQTRHEYVNECFRAGASGYVLKTVASKELPFAVREVLTGNKFISPELHWNPFHCCLEKPHFAELTTRQRQVLRLVGEGQSAKAIADKLSISSKTVEFHKSRIQFSLGLRSTADMIRYALSQP